MWSGYTIGKRVVKALKRKRKEKGGGREFAVRRKKKQQKKKGVAQLISISQVVPSHQKGGPYILNRNGVPQRRS